MAYGHESGGGGRNGEHGDIRRLRDAAAAGARLRDRDSGRAEERGDRIAKLQTLADLRKSGALTEQEFEREKTRLLGEA